MKIILLKMRVTPGGKVHPVGRNMDVDIDFGYELIARREAAELPQLLNGNWTLFGEPSNKMLTLRRTEAQPPITMDEYNNYVNPIKEEIKKKLAKQVSNTKIKKGE